VKEQTKKKKQIKEDAENRCEVAAGAKYEFSDSYII
jgi:hypothetical protein